MIECVDIISGILLAFVRTREVGVSSRNVVSRTFPHFSQSMLTPMSTILGEFILELAFSKSRCDSGVYDMLHIIYPLWGHSSVT